MLQQHAQCTFAMNMFSLSFSGIVLMSGQYDDKVLVRILIIEFCMLLDLKFCMMKASCLTFEILHEDNFSLSFTLRIPGYQFKLF